MARVFVSHASENLALAREVHQWLLDAGHEVFLDQDLRDGVALGEEWEQRLHDRLRWANAVICVVTSAYLDSTWCAIEIGITRSRGSHLLPLRAEPGAVHPLLKAVQHTDYTADPPAARAEVIRVLRRVDATWPEDRSPFPGLRPFEVDLHPVFFGRADEVEQLAELLRSPAERAEGAALLVVGPSGCGKSSLVRAGLVPVMAGEPGWLTLPPILPGADPVAALARELAAMARRSTLDWTVEHVHHQLDQRGLTRVADELLLADPAGPQQRLLVVVDQFEELLTQAGPTERARFAELLRLALTGPVRVVATLRPEFLDQLLSDPELAALLTRPYPLRPLGRQALRTVIEKPARLAGMELDDGLVDRLVDDTDSGEALPLLAFTLAQLAEGVSRGGRLSRARYDQLGGVQGALTLQADAALTDAVAVGGRSREQVIAGLLRLVTTDEQGRPTRWRVLRDELPDPVATELNAFVERRLLTTDEGNGSGVIGVAHEAFLSAWAPLAQAITQNASALRARRAVEHAATGWNENDRSAVRLWGGGQLAAVVADTGAHIRAGIAQADAPPRLPQRKGPSRRFPQRRRTLITDRVDLSPKARDFLQASIRRDRYRRRRATTVLSVLLVFALAAAGFAGIQQRTAEERQLVAIARQLVAQADASRDTDPRIALQLGVAAQHIDPGGEAQSSLVNTLTTTRYAGTLISHNGPVPAVAFSPADRNMLVTGGGDGTVTLWNVTDLTRPQQLGTLTGHRSLVSAVAFAPDGRTLATGSSDNTVILWGLTDRAQLRQLGPPLTSHTGSVTSLAFSGDGRTLATASDDGTAILWDLTDLTRPQQLGTLTGHSSLVSAVAFAPDGRTLATASDDGIVILWSLTDLTRPQQLSTLTGHNRRVSAVAFAPDGNTLATAGNDGTVILWDLADPDLPQLGTLTGHRSYVFSVAFAPDGDTLATASDDGTVILWDLADRAQPPRPELPLTGHSSLVNSVVFAPDGRTLTTMSSDDTEIEWDLTETPPHRLASRNLGSRLVNLEALSPDRNTLATGGSEGTVLLWDLTDRNQPRRLGLLPRGHRNSVNSLAFSADGNTLATGGSEGTVLLWDLTDRNQPRRLGQLPSGHRDLVNSVALGPDGNTLATAGNDGTVILWDLTDPARPRRLGQPLTHPSSVHSVAFSPDGNTLGTGSSDATVLLWDLTGLNQLRSHAPEHACFVAGRGPNEDEWDRYIPGLAYRNTCPA